MPSDTRPRARSLGRSSGVMIPNRSFGDINCANMSASGLRMSCEPATVTWYMSRYSTNTRLAGSAASASDSRTVFGSRRSVTTGVGSIRTKLNVSTFCSLPSS